MKLPEVSNVYPDSFAIYWRTDKVKGLGEKYAVKVKYTSQHADMLFEAEKTMDSILTVPFINDYTYEGSMLIYGVFFKNDVKILDRLSRPKIFKILSKNEKIEALKSLVDANPSIENLKLLADAFEEDKCFANAIQIYHRALLKDPSQGQVYFWSFYERNYEILNPKLDSAIR